MLVLRIQNEAYPKTHLFILPRFNRSFEIVGPKKPADLFQILDSIVPNGSYEVDPSW